MVHVVAVGDDLEELREIEEERVAPRPDKDLDAVAQLGGFPNSNVPVLATGVLEVPTSLGAAGP